MASKGMRFAQRVVGNCKMCRDERIYFQYYCDWKLRCDIVEAHNFANLTDMINAIGTQNLMHRKKS